MEKSLVPSFLTHSVAIQISDNNILRIKIIPNKGQCKIMPWCS